MDNARDVIARATRLTTLRAPSENGPTIDELTDAIIAALNDAGFEITPRTDGPWEWRKAKGVLNDLPPTPGPFKWED